MFRKTFILAAISIAAFLLTSQHATGSYQGDYTVSSYSQLFFGPGSITNSFGSTKELFIESGDLAIQPGSTYAIQFNEASMQRVIFDWRVSAGGEDFIYNAYTNIFTTEQTTDNGTFTDGANNTVDVGTGDGSMPLYFNANTNAALFITADEEGASYEEVGIGVIVRKSSGMSNADMNGTYIRYAIGNGNSGPTPRGRGNVDSLLMEQSIMQFDGLGNYSEQTDEWASHRVITENMITNGSEHYVDSYCTVMAPQTETTAENGTYMVDSSDGTMTLGFPDGNVSVQVSPDGNLIVTALAAADTDSAGGYLNIGVKQPSSMPTNAIDAVFFAAEISEEVGGDSLSAGNNHNRVEVGRSYIFFSSDGTFSMRTDYWNIENTLDNLHVQEAPHGILSYNRFTTESDPRIIDLSSGSYSLATNGVATLVFSNGDMGMAQLSENGQYVVYGSFDGEDGYAERWMGIGIKRHAPPAATEPVLLNSDLAMTPTGIVFSASVPTNVNVEILHAPDLTGGEWNSLMTTQSPDGNLQIHDPGASGCETKFYSATFGIW